MRNIDAGAPRPPLPVLLPAAGAIRPTPSVKGMPNPWDLGSAEHYAVAVANHRTGGFEFDRRFTDRQGAERRYRALCSLAPDREVALLFRLIGHVWSLLELAADARGTERSTAELVR